MTIEETAKHAPIYADLEYIDSSDDVHTVLSVDISAHLLRAFETTNDLATALANDRLIFDDLMGDQFLFDPELTDDDGNQHSYQIPSLDLTGALATAVGLSPDSPIDILWPTWRDRAIAGGVITTKSITELDSAIAAFGTLLYNAPCLTTPDGLQRIAVRLLRCENALEAISSAVTAYDGPDAVGAMRLAALLPATE